MFNNNSFCNDFVFNVTSCKKPISSLKFSYIKDCALLSFASWDKTLTVNNISNMTNATSFIQNTNTSSVILSQAFRPEGLPVLALGYALGQVTLLDLEFQKVEMLSSKHEIGTKCLLWKDANTLVSGGWDGKLLMHDIRMKTLSYSTMMNHRFYSMDKSANYILCGLSENLYTLLDMRNMGGVAMQYECKSKYPISSCAINPDETSLVVSSNSGIVEVRYINNNNSNIIYTFVPHKNTENELYSVNQVQFITRNILCTAGADGYMNFWDINKQDHLFYGYNESKAPVICFDTIESPNRTTFLMAYALGNDFSKGPMYLKTQESCYISQQKEVFSSKIGIHNIELSNLINKPL